MQVATQKGQVPQWVLSLLPGGVVHKIPISVGVCVQVKWRKAVQSGHVSGLSLTTTDMADWRHGVHIGVSMYSTRA